MTVMVLPYCNSLSHWSDHIWSMLVWHIHTMQGHPNALPAMLRHLLSRVGMLDTRTPRYTAAFLILETDSYMIKSMYTLQTLRVKFKTGLQLQLPIQNCYKFSQRTDRELPLHSISHSLTLKHSAFQQAYNYVYTMFYDTMLYLQGTLKNASCVPIAMHNY